MPADAVDSAKSSAGTPGIAPAPRVGDSLTIQGVSHAYAGIPAVSGVSFAVPAGGITALLGPSGCGKSTMLRIIAGLVRSASGRIFIGERDVSDVPARQRRVGMVFQNYALFPHMTVRENIGYGLAGAGRGERQARVEQMLALVRLEAFAERLPRQLSGGQQQRVAVARALAPRPSVLLLDEPFAALDRALRADMQVEFVRLQRDLAITTILVTHDQEEAQAVADSLVIMNGGRVEQTGDAAAIYDDPASLFVNTFVGEASVLPATVLAADGEGAILALSAGPELRMPGPVRFLPGSKVVLTVRPEHVRLHESAVPGSVPARRILSMPQGPHRVHDLMLADGTTLRAVEPRRPRAAAATDESAVYVTLALDEAKVFPAP